jgi:hypothetical protein
VRKISIFTVFYKSLFSINDIAKFRFLSIGKTFQFVFFLILFQFVPSIYKTLVLNEESALLLPDFDAGSTVIMLPIYLVFMYIFNVGFFFLKISILAYISSLLGKWFKRKLPYRQSWRLTACSIALPTVLFGLLQFFPVKVPYGFIIDLAITFLFIIGSIQKIPLPKHLRS